jgi:TRAP-type mannitol/chloroaromatic compound transport system permease small subunit
MVDAIPRMLDRVVAGIIRVGGILILPLGLLLFLQWPLRDVVQMYSREANDLAQVLFALYVSIAITYATRRDTHLATDLVAQRYSEGTRRTLTRVGSLFILVPWSLFILYAAWPMTVQSVRQLESFPETFNPGYFILKIALLLAAVLVLIQALLDAFRGRVRHES